MVHDLRPVHEAPRRWAVEGRALRDGANALRRPLMRSVLRLARALGAVAIAMGLCGCDGGAPSSSNQVAASTSAKAPVVKITDAVRARAKEYFSTVCATCHGPDGHG